MSITIKNVCKRYGNVQVLDNVNLEMPSGSLLAMLGPSGSGKTTLLRIIAGLECPDSGSVLYREEDVTNRAARDRNVGFVFQHYALFRHMNVGDNIAFALRIRGMKNVAIKQRVSELLHLVRLEGLERRFPTQLSGGQRQRVALARALAASPDLILLDEPFGALDAKVRQELRQELRKLHKELGVNCIFVTHDQEEAFELADHVVVMSKGRIEQVGTPEEVFEHPANAFVMDFLGHVNMFHGRVQNGKATINGMTLDYPQYGHEESRQAKLYVRRHELEISRVPGESGGMLAKVVHVNPAGSVTKVQLQSTEHGEPVHVDLVPERATELRLQTGEDVYVVPRRLRVFIPDYSI